MINLDKSNEFPQEVAVTLTEKCLLQNPNYLFVFEHTTTKEIVKFVHLYSEDLSEYKERANIFLIDAYNNFLHSQVGQWTYEVYEQQDQTLTIADKNLVECGKMLLTNTSTLTKQGYEPTTTIKGYAG